MKLYLIRHGESANNLLSQNPDQSGRVPDPELTERGHRQAQFLGEHMASPIGDPQHPPWVLDEDKDHRYGLTHIYCSLMTRSILTAQYIAQACGLPLVAHADIFENEGVYEEASDGTKASVAGPNRNYFAERFPDLQLPETLGHEGWYNRPFETEEMFLQRSKKVMLEFVDRHADTDDCVAMVIHGDLVDQLINELSGTPRVSENYSNHWVANWACHNTSITRIDFISGARTIVYTNRLQHIPPELVSW
ncbi:MAG: histidine phosphatase family protein [Rhodospirillales bacterium]|jgi:2,3-bisphosphoglycerate-dependent phosphoglycerate mutase|nr:histidine phosphatase family protein [Rhodospirillales bacterium]